MGISEEEKLWRQSGEVGLSEYCVVVAVFLSLIFKKQLSTIVHLQQALPVSLLSDPS